MDRNYCVCIFLFFFFFFFSSRVSAFLGDKNHCLRIVHHCSCILQCIVYGTYNPFIQKKNIKNGSYSTIHTFTNYFATVFSIFIFSKNKLYQNEVQNFWRPCLLFRSLRDTARDQVHVWWSHSF